MSDDKAHPGNTAAPTAAPAPAAPATPAAAAAPATAGGEKLADLMAHGAAAAAPAAKPAPNLEKDALRAAEQAIADGERALAAARAHLQHEPEPPAAAQRHRRRELALRVLLAVNLLAMVIVAMLPPSTDTVRTPTTPGTETPHATKSPAEQRRFNEPFNNALAAADRGAFAEAIAILERYLADNPRMLPSQRLNVFNMLAHYAGLASDFKKSQQYAQQAAAIGQSHSLPADLVEMAKAALASGDQETLRRVWARFLLQQKQIPSWLYKHVAEAYLQLGDSYRQEADAAAERARAQELADIAARLRQEAVGDKEKVK